MSVLEIILGAPRLEAASMDEFWKLLQRRTQLPCVQVAVDVGSKYVHVNPQRSCEIVFQFLVEDDFDPLSDYKLVYGYFGRAKRIVPEMANAYPMPIISSSTLEVRGKVVVAAFSLKTVRDMCRGWYQIGDWVLSPDFGKFAFMPKDFVLDMHLTVFPYNARPGCTCCKVVSDDEAEELTRFPWGRRTQLTDRLLCGQLKQCGSIVEDYGEEVVARFLDDSTGPHYRLPLCSMRLARVREQIRWSNCRRDVICILGIDSNLDRADLISIFSDARLKSKKGGKRMTSFFSGSVVLFL
jgi:hypothetical protein